MYVYILIFMRMTSLKWTNFEDGHDLEKVTCSGIILINGLRGIYIMYLCKMIYNNKNNNIIIVYSMNKMG